MMGKLFETNLKHKIVVRLALCILFLTINYDILAETNIPDGATIQPPSRFVWTRNNLETRGLSEKQLEQATTTGGYVFFPSYQTALESLRQHVCQENGGAWLCHPIEEFPFYPGYNGWIWGYKFCRPYEPGYCSWQASSRNGICPGDLIGYRIKDIYGVDRYGYIACPVPSYPDGEKDLAKPDECGDKTPNPVYIALGRKELTVPIYNTGNSTFPIDFQLLYQHNDKKRSAVAWRHTYYKFIVLDGQETPTSARIYRGKGALIFNKDLTTNEWKNDDDITDSLIEIVDDNNEQTGWIYIDRFFDLTEYYDIAGKLISIENRNGLTHTLKYNQNEQLSIITDSYGQQIEFTYDSNGNFASLIDPSSNSYQFNYDTTGNLVSVTYPDGKTRTYHYNEQAYTSGANLPSALTGITDENGVRYATYHYDTQGRAIITEHAGGADRHELHYSDDGSSTVVVDPLGSEYIRQFKTILGVAKSVGQSQPTGSGCSAASSATTYDVNGNVASRTDFNGNKTCYSHDLNRNLEIVRVEGLPAGSSCPTDLVNYAPALNTAERKTLTSWHAEFRLPVQVTENGRETSITYDTYGNVTQLSIRDTINNETRSWHTSYLYHPTVPGVIMQRIEDGPRSDVSDVTTIDYYAPDENCLGGHFGCRAQISRVTNALGHITDIVRYNAHGQPEEIINPNGLRITLTYDVRQRLITRVVGSETTSYQYDSVGQLTQLTRPDGSRIVYTYDAAHRLTSITDSHGNRIRYTLDAAGNRIREEIFDASNTLAQTRQQEFDALSRLWKLVGAQNQTTELAYDANGNLKQATDPLSNSTRNQYDALNRLIQVNDPLGGKTLQQHDALDQLTKVTDPKGINTTYTTNAFGDVTQEISQDRGTTTYTYDAAGNQLTKTDARGVVQATAYDALNRPISQSYTIAANIPPTGTISWVYDSGTNSIGRLTQLRDESGTTDYQYDQNGRLLSKTQLVTHNGDNFVQSLSYQYNANGQLIRTTYPSGAQIDAAYGADGRPIELRVNGMVLMKDITYRPFGEPESWQWGNGQPHNRSFDLDGRLTQHPLSANTQTLSYDAASRIVGTTHSNPVYNRTYEYDALDRLIRQADNTSTRLWDYDANSNRIFEQSGATVYPYTIDPPSNRLLTVAGPVAKIYRYDAAGNALSDGTLDFAWNAAGRMVQASTRNNITDYRYNGHGERVLKQSQRRTRGGPYLYVYNNAGQLIGDYAKTQGGKQTVNWVQQQETIWLDDIPVAVIKQSQPTEPIQLYFIHADHLNTPRVIVDQANTVVWQWHNQNAFGNNPPDEDPDGNRKLFEYNLRFAGQYFDSETNLHYNYFRDYESATGRYLSSDPIGLSGELNTYGYVLNNPLKYIDPYGLDITISFNPNAAAGFGHVGLGVNTPNTVGQRPHPSASSIQVLLGMKVPGVISLDPIAPSNITIPTTPEQDRNAQLCIDTRTQQQQDYNLYNNNCTQFVAQCLGAAGINISNTIFPKTLFNNLQQNFGGNP